MLLRIPFGVPGLPLPPASDRRSLATTSFRILRRESHSMPSKTSIIVGGVIVGIIGLVLAIILIRAMRARHPNPKYIPTPFLKRLWTSWQPSSIRYHRTPGENNGRRNRGNRAATHDAANEEFSSNLAAEQVRVQRESGVTVDRNTSVRSVMTLPAYRMKASDAERVLGVEGERDGIDVVVEMPTAEEEEAMRDQEMEALYQIRQARRRQLAEREERRQRRQDARTRHDNVALREIRDEARAASTSNTEEIADLREDHERAKETRQRAVSSVSYADVGIARLDGTRLRANSMESERAGLLSDAASIAAGSIAASTRSPTSLSYHHLPATAGGRQRSGSVLSVDTSRSQPGSPGLPSGGRLSRPTSRAPSPRRLSSSMTRAGSSPELIDSAEADLGDADMPPHSPPGYDEVSLVDNPAASVRSMASRSPSPYPDAPPDYPGPTEARNQRLSAHVADLLASEGGSVPGVSRDDEPVPRRNSRGVGGVPQLPSLRLAALPQIVVEPSSAMPRDNNDRRYHEQF